MNHLESRMNGGKHSSIKNRITFVIFLFMRELKCCVKNGLGKCTQKIIRAGAYPKYEGYFLIFNIQQ